MGTFVMSYLLISLAIFHCILNENNSLMGFKTSKLYLFFIFHTLNHANFEHNTSFLIGKQTETEFLHAGLLYISLLPRLQILRNYKNKCLLGNFPFLYASLFIVTHDSKKMNRFTIIKATKLRPNV